MKLKILGCFVLLLCSNLAVALETASSELGTKVPTANVNILEWMLSCVAVIFMLFGLAYLLKRAKFIPGIKGGVLKVEAMINVGNREKVALIRVGSQYLLIGITPSQITRLGEIDYSSFVSQTESSDKKNDGSFSDKLHAILGKKGNTEKESDNIGSSDKDEVGADATDDVNVRGDKQ